MKLSVACPVVWDYKRKPCEAWGAKGSHGCKKEPKHTGKHVCLCGSSTVDAAREAQR